MTFLVAVTRPEPFATQTAQTLIRAGYTALSAPLLRAEIVAPLGDPGPAKAIALTSRTAARLLQDAPAFHTIPTYCVGAATAREAQQAGAKDVVSTVGTVDDLFALMREKAPAPVLHLSGEDQRGDLAARLTAAGIPAERRVIYRMAPNPVLPSIDTPLGAVLLYSPRTAAIFRDAASDPPWDRAACVALSEAVAECLAPRAPAAVAAAPSEAALLDALAGLRASRDARATPASAGA